MLKFILAGLVLVLTGYNVHAFQLGEVKTTNFICLDKEVILNIAKAIDSEKYGSDQQKSAVLIQQSVDEQKCAYGADDDFKGRLVERIWTGNKIEVWRVEPETITEGQTIHPAYMGFTRDDKDARNTR